MNNAEIALQLARARHDAPGLHRRTRPLQDALGGGPGRARIALDNARAAARAAGNKKLIHWIVPQKIVYDYQDIRSAVAADGDLWTVRTWRQHTDESEPSIVGVSSSTAPYRRIGNNPHGGLTWNRTLLPVADGYGPVMGDADDGTQEAGVLIELLDAAGATLKTAATTVTYEYHPGDLSYARAPWIFDADPPIDEFWQLRATLTFADTPIWVSALNPALAVGVTWFRGLFE